MVSGRCHPDWHVGNMTNCGWCRGFAATQYCLPVRANQLAHDTGDNHDVGKHGEVGGCGGWERASESSEPALRGTTPASEADTQGVGVDSRLGRECRKEQERRKTREERKDTREKEKGS